MELVKIVLLLAGTLLLTPKCIRTIEQLLREAGCVLKNYRGCEVVSGMGILFIPILLMTSSSAMLLFPHYNRIYGDHLFLVFAMGFAGLLDDFIGNKAIKGLRKHILQFIKGRLTTGFFKAFTGFFVSLIAAFYMSSGLWDFLLSLCIMALFTNALNLMDLRPGRCVKVFLAIGILLILFNIKKVVGYVPLLIMMTSGGLYLKNDLKELCMLGDTGSNILGITLGYFCALSFGLRGKLIIFIVLLLLNLAAEKVSISKIISHNPILNYLDQLGRSSG